MAASRPVVEIGQFQVNRVNQKVGSPIVIEVARGKPARHLGHLPRGARGIGGINKLSPRKPDQKLRGHLVGNLRTEVVDVPVRGREVEPAVVVHIQKGHPETKPMPRGHEQVRRDHVQPPPVEVDDPRLF